MYITSQILGVLASVVAVIAFQMRKKWQILLVGLIANLLSVFVFLMLNGLSSAVTINIIAVFQCGINAFLAYKEKYAGVLQKVIFTVLFLLSGFLQYSVFLDILPIISSMLFMCSTFQKKEQNVRIWSALNVSVWIIYDIIIGTTAVFGQIISLVSIIIAIYRYRNTSKRSETEVI